MGGRETTNPLDPGEADLARSPGGRAYREHNDGHRVRGRKGSESSSHAGSGGAGSENGDGDGEGSGSGSAPGKLGVGGERPAPKVFSAQSYLRYQGDKVSSPTSTLCRKADNQFTSRFDANCYIHITRKLDTHDLSHPSIHSTPPTPSSSLPPPVEDETDIRPLHHALSTLPPALVIGIESDGLFTTTEQKELAAHIPDSELVLIPSQDGHDGFLLEFEAINEWVDGWFKRKIPEYYGESGRVVTLEEYGRKDGWGVKKESVFGEAEGADVTAW